jgi:hypothetical protein
VSQLEAEKISLNFELSVYKSNRFGDPQALLERVNELESENAFLKEDLKEDLKVFRYYKLLQFHEYRLRHQKLVSEKELLRDNLKECVCRSL